MGSAKIALSFSYMLFLCITNEFWQSYYERRKRYVIQTSVSIIQTGVLYITYAALCNTDDSACNTDEPVYVLQLLVLVCSTKMNSM